MIKIIFCFHGPGTSQTIMLFPVFHKEPDYVPIGFVDSFFSFLEDIHTFLNVKESILGQRSVNSLRE